MVKKKCINTDQASPEKPEKNTLEKEINELIDREKTKSKIVSKLINQNIPPK